jgi:phthalate 4,5-cis-dihydrodiol dehydrogenase
MISAQLHRLPVPAARPEEPRHGSGSGAIFSQAAHQVDIVRLLGGGQVVSVRALTGAWDGDRPTEGAYAALFAFADGAFASLAYSGYAHFDSDEFCGGVSEMGAFKDANQYGAARRNLRRAASPEAEMALKNARNYGGDAGAMAADGDHASWHQHFGVVLVSSERRSAPAPTGVMIYGDDTVRLDPLSKPTVPRSEVIDELYDAIVLGRPPLHDRRWAMATLEVCLAMLTSAREHREVSLQCQVRAPS